MPSVEEALKGYCKTPHGFLEEKAIAKLKRMGYKITDYDHAPKWIREVDCPNIIAVKDGEYILVKVKLSDQLRRYSMAKAKLVLVTNVEEGKAIEVWGLKELET